MTSRGIGVGEGIKRTGWGLRSCRIIGWVMRFGALAAVVALIVAFGVRQMKPKIAIAKPITFIGHADDAAYAAMGVSLAEGRGLEVNYISTFFIPYPATITHREDHWPPFMGFAIAPLVYFWGKAAWIAKLPAIFFGSIGLPLATALLAYALSRRGYVALIAGGLLMLNPYVYEESLRTLSDIATAMLVAGFLGSIILARRYAWMHLLAGACAAGAYFAKGSELGLFALYPLIGLLACGISVWRRGWFYAGFATALFLAAPFWYSSWKLYGNPLHSTQNYVSSFYGFEDWDSNMYAPYWGYNLPKLSDRWTKHGGLDKPTSTYLRVAHVQMEEIAQFVFTGAEGTPEIWQDFGHYGERFRKWLLGSSWRSFDPANDQASAARPMRPVKDWVAPLWELPAAASYCLFWFLIFTWPLVWGIEIYIWFRRRGMRKRGEIVAPVSSREPAWMVGPMLAVVVVIAFHWIFLAYMWQVMPRFCLPMLPLIAALGCTAGSRLFEWPIAAVLWTTRATIRFFRKKRGEPKWVPVTAAVFSYWHILATLLFAGWIYLHFDKLAAQGSEYVDQNVSEGQGFVDQPRWFLTGTWIKKKLPTAVIMCRSPWELQYYMGPENKSIGLPYPADPGPRGADQLFAIAHYYGVTHFLLDESREELEPYLDQEKPGFTRVAGAPDNLYAIDWSKIRVKPLDQLFGPKVSRAAISH